MMNGLKGRDTYTVTAINALRPVGFQSIAGTPVQLKSTQSTWYGYSINNNDASVRWLQVFFRPATGVVLGVTAPDMTIAIPASGNATFELENPVLAATGFTVACTTAETGSTGASSGATGQFFFGRD